jgi:hypothetical protein
MAYSVEKLHRAKISLETWNNVLSLGQFATPVLKKGLSREGMLVIRAVPARS